MTARERVVAAVHLHLFFEQRQPLPGPLPLALLGEAVDQPHQGVIALVVVEIVRAVLPGHRFLERANVAVGALLPHAQGEVDVRPHVQGVYRRRRDADVVAGHPQPQRRVDRVVVTVNRVVQRTGMQRVLLQYLLADGARPHVLGVVAPVGLHEDVQGVERRRVQIVGVFLVQRPQRFHVSEVALVLGAFPEQDLDARQVVLLPLGPHPCRPRLRRGSHPLQHGPGPLRVGSAPEAVFPGQRFAPVGHAEIRIDGQRLLERGACVRVFEIVKLQQATQERRLGLGRARGFEFRHPVVLLRLYGQGQHRGSQDQREDSGGFHRFHLTLLRVSTGRTAPCPPPGAKRLRSGAGYRITDVAHLSHEGFSFLTNGPPALHFPRYRRLAKENGTGHYRD